MKERARKAARGTKGFSHVGVSPAQKRSQRMLSVVSGVSGSMISTRPRSPTKTVSSRQRQATVSQAAGPPMVRIKAVRRRRRSRPSPPSSCSTGRKKERAGSKR